MKTGFRPDFNASCSFCGKRQSEAKKLIAGPGVYICDECIILCKNILDKETHVHRKDAAKGIDVPKPSDIKAQLDEYVIGQERVKRHLSVAVHNHYRRITMPPDETVELEKSNILLIGPTGAARRFLRRRWRSILNVPSAFRTRPR